jgi:PhoPQ-activated pathogenicity-related protein
MARRTGLWVAVVAGVVLAGAPARADLAEYIKKPEPKYNWKLKERISSPQGTIYDLELVSQEWHGIVWTHQVQVYQPKEASPAATMLVYNTGGTSNPGNVAFGMELASKIKAPVAILYGIPNQPLLGDRKEDALIAETFVRHLDSKDDSWPLLFPMAKSVVKALDALQAFSKEEWKEPVKDFVVSGASKRGWTTWLAAASDPRVKAFAPLVIDTLNMTDQMEHQKQSFGAYSDMIHDYTERGLVPIPKTDEARRLWQMVDPYFYRDKLKQPKLLINGNNDPYWTVDALNLYWDELKGEKYVVYVPNAGHDLNQGTKDKPDRTRAVNALAAFARHETTNKPLPQLTWRYDAGAKLRLTVEVDQAPKAARLWVATAPTKDFRKAKWVEQAATLDGTKVKGVVDPPAEGCLAFYAELDYEIDGIPYHLCTQLRVTGQPKPAAEKP